MKTKIGTISLLAMFLLTAIPVQAQSGTWNYTYIDSTTLYISGSEAYITGDDDNVDDGPALRVTAYDGGTPVWSDTGCEYVEVPSWAGVDFDRLVIQTLQSSSLVGCFTTTGEVWWTVF